ncbi:SET and MYND domain-containing protein 1-like [Tropilaelaps mercedesae]|uniref:SET and MYND domain-containing protein 1-like n=1 Tax=Tropilaelaps mercedesae TaxID=418985 RepID=A0A1V9XAU2_9ACAR|nr:SET and MYND domain-containing protein 1-like [Tropilaelaps mercedesae]
MGSSVPPSSVVKASGSLPQTFKPGDIMIEEDPYACSIDGSYLGIVCSYCIRRTSGVRCPRCNAVNYCNNECKMKDSGYHALECKVLQNARGNKTVDGEMRLVVRALERSIRERQAGFESVGDYFGHRRTFRDLLAHLDKLSIEDLATARELAMTLFNLIKGQIVTTIEEILVVIGKVRINCHALIDHNSPHAFVRGRAVYLAVSKMNHSCVERNYVQIFDGRRYTLRAIGDVEVTNPFTLTIHYIPPTMPLKIRQRRLLKAYYFVCTCEKCVWQTKHPEQAEVDDNLVRQIETAFEGRNSYTKWYTIGNEFLNELKYLPPSNFYVNWLLSQMQWTCKEIGLHEESIYYGTRALRGTESILTLERIFYGMCESMVVLGWNQPGHANHGGFLEALKLTKKLYELTHGKRHSIVVSLDIMVEQGKAPAQSADSTPGQAAPTCTHSAYMTVQLPTLYEVLCADDRESSCEYQFPMFFKTDETIIEDDPYANSMSNDCINRFCSYCYTEDVEIMCERCNILGYSNEEYQSKDKVDHDLECKILQSLSKGDLSNVELQSSCVSLGRQRKHRVRATSFKGAGPHNKYRAYAPRIVQQHGPGDVMIQEDPYACSIDQDLLGVMCSYCIRKRPGVVCSRCNVIKYCNAECEAKDKLFHELECKVLQSRTDEDIVDKESRLVIRTLDRCIRERREGYDSVGDFFGYRRTIHDLQTHVQDMTESRREKASRRSKFIYGLVKDFTETSLKQVFEIFLKCRLNKTSLIDHNSHRFYPCGSALYLAVSKMNHSCVETSYVQIYDGRKYTLRALRDIQVDNPLALTVHYIPPNLPFVQRQKYLLQNYYFICNCAKCCWQARNPEVEADESVIAQIEESFNSSPEYNAWYAIGSDFLEKLSNLPDSNFYVNWLLIQMQWTCSMLGRLEESVYYGTRALRGTEVVTSIETILFHMCDSLVKLGWHKPTSDKYAGFCETMKLAKKLFLLTHGSNHKLYRALESMQKSGEVSRHYGHQAGDYRGNRLTYTSGAPVFGHGIDARYGQPYLRTNAYAPSTAQLHGASPWQIYPSGSCIPLQTRIHQQTTSRPWLNPGNTIAAHCPAARGFNRSMLPVSSAYQQPVPIR